MASMFCNKCGEEIEVPASNRRPFITCPKCKNAIQVSASQPVRAPAPARPQTSAPQPTAQRPQATAQANQFPSSPAGNALPETMKANKRIAGQPCSICSRPINLGEQIHNCPSCHSINHDSCWRQSGGCPSASCNTFQPPAAPQRSNLAPSSPSGNSVPCRWCKEPIIRGAKKCKHCNEFQSDSDRATQSKNFDAPIDSTLTVTDWIGVLCCPIVGFIQGAIYASRGDPKGKKLMLYSAISMFIGGIIKAAGR